MAIYRGTCEAVAAAVAVNQVQCFSYRSTQEESWMTPLHASRLFGEDFLKHWLLPRHMVGPQAIAT